LMATTTVAAGRIRNKADEKLPAPDGRLLDREAAPLTIRWWPRRRAGS
jgi:LDH2 family malate/lactate/ureidoglycolate dehydrogenase